MECDPTRLTSHHFIAVLPVAQSVYQWREADFVNLLRTAVQQAQLTIVGEAAFSFTPTGVSAVALLAESHIALHFWPEHGKVTIDIHICDYSDRNRQKAETLAQQMTEKLSRSPDPNLQQWQQFSTQG
ncbi:MAG: S-adenosylmethionine decarboxylase [Leptolyngbyaceae cyanobacterium SM1_3_5]|nr:S-adenosylmethionine decarboxylase [Leptolyngbyaceae cyanobacterium SM1_3_5]